MFTLKFIIAGIAGALASDILGDGYLKLPEIKDKKFYPGFLGGIIIGAIIGFVVDSSVWTSFTVAYMGKEAIDSLVYKKELNTQK